MKISIIGGGNMGGAIARGLSQSSIVAPSEITVSNRGEEKLNELKSFNPSINTTTDKKEAETKLRYPLKAGLCFLYDQKIKILH